MVFKLYTNRCPHDKKKGTKWPRSPMRHDRLFKACPVKSSISSSDKPKPSGPRATAPRVWLSTGRLSSTSLSIKFGQITDDHVVGPLPKRRRLDQGKWSPLRVTQDELKAWTDPTVRGE